jgi:hypothetical protein
MFADNSEETVEANYGMMLWGNMNYNYNQATMGFSTGWDLSYGIYTNRGWTQPNLITYQESHDEERLMYKNEQYGNISGTYSVKDTATALKRNAMAAAFWAMTPGPKMLWEFGELGYDYSINTCVNGTVDATGNCRLDMKPVKWNYYNNANRLALYNVYANLLKLRNTSNYIGTFTSGTINYNLSNAFKTLTITSDSLNIVVIGNFDVTAQTGTVTFPSSGTWYNYLSTGTHAATGIAESITLQPGEYYVYTNKNVTNSVVTAVNNNPVNSSNDLSVHVYPNPIQSSATIQYTLPESGNVNISVLDLNGRRLSNLINGFKTKGTQTFLLNQNIFRTNVISNGMYFIEIELNGRKKLEKVFINK